MKVHVSESTKAHLDQAGGFLLEKRGTIEIKVKLKTTFENRNELKRPPTGKRKHGYLLAAWT